MRTKQQIQTGAYFLSATGTGTGKQRRDEGKALAAEHRKLTLKHAQEIAKSLSQVMDHGKVTIDDVRDAMTHVGDNPNDLGNAAGSVFTGKHWRRVGSVQSKRPEAHARWISVWVWEAEKPVEPVNELEEHERMARYLVDQWQPSDLKIQAIKDFRTQTGCALKYSREIIDRFWGQTILKTYKIQGDGIVGGDKPVVIESPYVEYWYNRCIKQEAALDACLVSTTGVNRGLPLTHSEIIHNEFGEADGVDTGWDGPEAARLIERALKARKIHSDE